MLDCSQQFANPLLSNPIIVPVKPKSSGKRSSQNQSWVDIFAAAKVVVSIQTRNPGCSEVLIQHAQDEFFKNFGYTPEDLPIPLKNLYGKASIRFISHKILTAILMGKSACEYQNLYKKNGQVLSCHIYALSLTGNGSMIRNNPLLVPNPQQYSTKYAVLTIRSASVIGNSVFSGIGFLGVDRVSAEKLAEIPECSKPKKNKGKEEPVSTTAATTVTTVVKKPAAKAGKATASAKSTSNK